MLLLGLSVELLATESRALTNSCISAFLETTTQRSFNISLHWNSVWGLRPPRLGTTLIVSSLTHIYPTHACTSHSQCARQRQWNLVQTASCSTEVSASSWSRITDMTMAHSNQQEVWVKLSTMSPNNPRQQFRGREHQLNLHKQHTWMTLVVLNAISCFTLTVRVSIVANSTAQHLPWNACFPDMNLQLLLPQRRISW